MPPIAFLIAGKTTSIRTDEATCTADEILSHTGLMTESYSQVKVGPSVVEIALPIAEKIGDRMPQTV